MRRRDFISLGGTAILPLMVIPRLAGAQQAQQVRRIGVLMSSAADDSEAKVRTAIFQQVLQERGWTMGRNLQLDYRWGPNIADRLRRDATELAALSPDVIVASTGTAAQIAQEVSPNVSVVFVGIIDAVAGGRVESLARPGGNATGFISLEYGLSGKFLELLKEVAPRMTRVAVLRDPTTPGGSGQYGALQAASPSYRVELTPINVRDPGAIERGMAAFAREPNGGLIVQASALATFHRETIIALAARYRLPAVYANSTFVSSGGLISYGATQVELWRGAADYVDRILRGTKPADLPVQTPTKYELAINLKTAKALGLEIPPTLITRADEVIE